MASNKLIQCFTLIDITQTNTVGSYKDKQGDYATWTKSRNQQRNWETILQGIGLRTQLVDIDKPNSQSADLTKYKFGSIFLGQHTVWTFRFGIEYPEVYNKDNTEFLALLEDMDNIPCILGLDETAPMAKSTFKTFGSELNTYFQKL